MNTTPMMLQYNSIKKKHQDAILFFRLGDFYEMFDDDAKLASKELSLTLTGRGKDDQRVPMCGVPHHAAENYISKLVRKGYKVAICEQVESVNESKGPTKREVVRIITPGTAQLDPILDQNESNYLVAICKVKAMIGFAYIDLSTGEFKCDVFQSLSKAIAEMHRIQAKEVLVDDAIMSDIQHSTKSSFFPYDVKQAEASILKHFNIQHVSVFKIESLNTAFPAIAGILDYLEYTQKGAFSQIQSCVPAKSTDYCAFDDGVMNHLDIFSSSSGLFSLLNKTKTSLGARKLRQWLSFPLIDIKEISKRQRCIRSLLQHGDNHLFCIKALDGIQDIERLLSKICGQFNNPKDSLGLKQTLETLPNMIQLLQQLGDAFSDDAIQLQAIISGEQSLLHLLEELKSALQEDVPSHIRDGGIFRPGYSQELDDLCQSFKDVRQWIKELEPKCREQLGIKSLKVGYNKVFGYYIEVPHTQQDKIPDHFIRKQTLTNAERYITPHLKEKETILLNAQEQQANLECNLYAGLVSKIQTYVSQIQIFASVIATLDVIQSLATVANQYGFSCPKIIDLNSRHLVFKGLWHPTVAAKQDTSFIRNDVSLSNEHPFMLITGPNMAGKSTVMRSVALCVILAQMGSMVPAEYAEFDIVEQIFTRIGASDKLAEGQSTFMVEMVETATICHNASEKSLILLDEIGRGTSTFDGVSIAAAVSEYLVTDIKARTLFATHYHELTALSDKYPEIVNSSMQIKEVNNELVFTYKLMPGSAEKSYGVTVAKMAGLPKKVTESAQQWLDRFEKKALSGAVVQLTLFD